MSYKTEDIKWVTFYPTFNSNFYVERAGYFDERPRVHTSITQLITLVALPFLLIYSLYFFFLIPFLLFGWGSLYINLPIKTGIQDSESSSWGFNYHDNTIWIYIGGGGNFEGGKKSKTITMPWYIEWYRKSTLLKDDTWHHETKKNRKNWFGNVSEVGSHRWLEANRIEQDYDYTDKYDNTVIQASYYVEETDYRMKGLKWTSLFSKVRRDIQVNFLSQVGREKGSFKGGVLGCGYEIKGDETPRECIERMERERVF